MISYSLLRYDTTKVAQFRLGKEKIKPLLDEHCQQAAISSISESTIGKVIKRNNFFYQKSGRVYHHPASKWALKSVKRKKRLRVRHPLKHQEFGPDNGLEFLGECDQYLEKKAIPHYFTYPRCPRINGVVERYQRTIQEEFLNLYRNLTFDRIFGIFQP